MTTSVIVATYGDEKWARLARERALPSVDGQGAHEVIVTHRVEVTRGNLQNGTLADARNYAAAKATGEWLCVLDADDELAPGYLQAMYLAKCWHATNPGSGYDIPTLLIPRVQYVHEDGRAQPPEFPNRHAPIEHLNHAVIGTLVPRRLFRSVGGFRPELPIYEDWALTLACIRAGAKLVYVDDAVYRAHVRDDGRNNVGGKVAYDTYWAIRNEHEALTAEAAA